MKTDLAQAFLNPPGEFSPLPFWFWNDYLARDEILRQINEFHAKGIMGFVIHPRMGLPREIEYLSDGFLDTVELAVAEAARLGMLVFLYDEAMYPSGSAHGLVVASNPAYATRGLRMIEYPCSGPLEITPDLRCGEIIVSAQAATMLPSGAISPGGTTILPYNGGIRFTPPDNGLWSVLLFVETFSGSVIRGIHIGEDDWESGAPPAADLLNPDAVATFIRITYDRYHQRLGRYFGATIPAIFTDEPRPFAKRPRPGLIMWTGGSLQWYTSLGGHERDLPALFRDAGPETASVRRRYERALHQRMMASYFKPISAWCAAHNIALTGHPHASDDIGSQRYLQIPGQDLALRWVAPEDGKALSSPHSTQAKCSADAARHFGRRRNLNECFGCCGKLGQGYSLTADDLKWFMDWLFVRGVNWLLPHAFYYSTRGPRRLGERPPDVGPNNIWWPWWHSIAAYMKRLSWLNTDGHNVTPVAVLCQGDYLPWAIVEPLYKSQIEFNYLEDTLLTPASCAIERGTIAIQQQRYRLLLAENPAWLQGPILERLQPFVASGGLVVIYNPDGAPLPLEGVHQAQSLDGLSSLVAGLCPPDLVLTPPHPDLRASHIVKGETHFYLLVNEGEQAITGSLRLSVVGKAQVWDAWTGSIQDAPAQVVEGGLELGVALERRSSLVICIDPASAPEITSPSAPAAGRLRTMPLDGEWTLRECPARASDVQMFHSWTEWPGMAHFSGTIAYEHALNWPPNGAPPAASPVILDLGRVEEIAQVFVNDRAAGVQMWAPYRFDIAPYLTPGRNRIRVAVTNTLANAIDKQSLPSGLLGPVKIWYS